MLVVIMDDVMHDNYILVPKIMIDAIKKPRNYTSNDIPLKPLFMDGQYCITCEGLYRAASRSSSPVDYLTDLFDVSLFSEPEATISQLLKYCDYKEYQVQAHFKL